MRPVLLSSVRKGEYFTLTNKVKCNEDGEEEPLSPEEYSASKRMYDLCQEYIQLFEELEEDAL